MKKLSKILSLLLCGTVAVGVCACDNGGTDEPSGGLTEKVVYADFERWAPDFQTIRVLPYSGALHVNKDTAYAKDNQSLLIHPLGRYTSGEPATFVFPLKSDTFGFDYRDLRKTTSISFEFYNAENTVQKVAVGLTPTIKSTESITYTKTEWQELAPNAWTTISYNVDTRSLGFVYDVTSIAGFYMKFENVGSREEEDAPDIYLDNITLHRITYNPPETESFVLNGMEYLDFEDVLQNGMIEVGGRAETNIQIVKAANEKVDGKPLEATSGENVLKMEFMPVAETSSNWSYLCFADVVTQNSKFKDLTMEDAKNMVLSFDIYNACDVTTYIEFDFRYYDDCMFGGFDLAPHQWSTFRYRLDDVLARYPDFAQHGKLQFVMSEFTGTQSKVFYLDNIRFEWASDLAVNG